MYPEHLTEELDYELELAVVISKPGKWFPPEEARDYIGGYVIFNDITARDIQRREMRSGVFSFCKAIDTFCPLGPWIVTPDEIPEPHDLAMELRVNGEVRQTSHSGRMSVTIPEILSHYSALGYSAGDVVSTGHRLGRRGLLAGRGLALPPARRRDGGRDRADRRAPEPGRLVGGGARRASRRRACAGNCAESVTIRPHPSVADTSQGLTLISCRVGRECVHRCRLVASAPWTTSSASRSSSTTPSTGTRSASGCARSISTTTRASGSASSVLVTRDGSRLFLYADSEAQAREAERVVREPRRKPTSSTADVP